MGIISGRGRNEVREDVYMGKLSNYKWYIYSQKKGTSVQAHAVTQGTQQAPPPTVDNMATAHTVQSRLASLDILRSVGPKK